MQSMARPLIQHLPRALVFGPGVVEKLAPEILAINAGSRVVLVVDPAVQAASVEAHLQQQGLQVLRYAAPPREPRIADVHAALSHARDFKAQVVVGLGGGSAMDLAKLVAILIGSPADLRSVIGIDKVRGRKLPLICIPTTAGTGSEVSPNAIVLDEDQNLKVGVISCHLVPDAAFVDPQLTLSVPPAVTAATGLDALTHCIEAYVNRFAHPMVDLYALEGIRLIAANLCKVVANPQDIEGRSALLLGSLYGGMCLGPVNTGAVHALAYPLGSAFHVAHGVSNAVLLAAVMEFNLPAAPDRYADVALALGASAGETPEQTARHGLRMIQSLVETCKVPRTLASLGVPAEAIPSMALQAMKVTRLLERNVKPVTSADAEQIYRRVYE
jgi:alcohol dehydrogenase class IV